MPPVTTKDPARPQTTVDLEQLRDWLATQRYDVDEHMGDAYAVGWSHAVTHVIAELPRYWERIARGEYSVGHSPGGSLSSAAGLVGGEPGNTRPNQAGADGNGVDGQTFSRPARDSVVGTTCADDIGSLLPHERLLPGVIARLDAEVELATNDMVVRLGDEIDRLQRGLDELRDAEAECFCGSVPGLRHLDDDGHLPHCPAKPIRDANAQRRDPVRLEWEDVE